MKGSYKPTTATRRPGIITATVLQWTGASPSMDIMERARRWEAREADAFVSVFYGYPWSDVPDVGATIHVMTNNDQELADRIADDMNDYFWRVREEFAVGRYPLPDEAAADRPAGHRGGGHPGGGGGSLRSSRGCHPYPQGLRESRNRSCPLWHPHRSGGLEALEEAGAQAGDAFDMEIGGFTPSGGTPFRIPAR